MNVPMSFKNIELCNIVLRNEPFVAREEELNNLTKSIKEHGIYAPISVRPIRYRDYEVLDGRKRITILQELGIERVPCIVYDYMSDTKAKEFYNLLHSSDENQSNIIEREVEVTELLKNLMELVEKLSSEYHTLIILINDTMKNDANMDKIIEKCMLVLLNLRYDIQNTKNLSNSNAIMNYLNNIQNLISILENRITNNNTNIIDISNRILGILDNISSILVTTNSLLLYKNGKQINNKCGNC